MAKEEIKKLVENSKIVIDDELDNIINSYDKLIYFWEDNPVENLRKEEQSEWLMWSIKKSIWKVL